MARLGAVSHKFNLIIINTSKFRDAGGNSWNEREGSQPRGMDQQERMEKENKTLSTERCENIDTLYINNKS